VRNTRKIKAARKSDSLSPEVKKQRRIIHNLRNAIHSLRELGLDDEANALERFTEDVAASF
jgi:signal transduction histidine kinase